MSFGKDFGQFVVPGLSRRLRSERAETERAVVASLPVPKLTQRLVDIG
jgi:hypothetical protein